jgi:hypothetical protein
MPSVELGLVNLIPDPCSFDVHLRDQMLHMAESRSAGVQTDRRKEPRIEQLMKQDFQRGLMSLPRDALRSQLLKALPKLDEVRLEETLSYVEQLKERDPFPCTGPPRFRLGASYGFRCFFVMRRFHYLVGINGVPEAVCARVRDSGTALNGWDGRYASRRTPRRMGFILPF